MHPAVKKFIKECRRHRPSKFRFRNILEVGSHNINGSPRPFFWLCKYTGVDITPGKGVDLVGRFTDMQWPSDYYHSVISVECLEHDSDWKQSLLTMYHTLKDDGMLLITCAAPHRKEHGTTRSTTGWCSPDTTEYYKNITLEEFESVLPQHLFDTYILQYARGQNDLQFYGIKAKNHFSAPGIDINTIN